MSEARIDSAEIEALQAELALLKEENQRLRKEIDTHVAVVLKCNVDLESSDARLSQMREALDRLTGEVDACWGMAEVALRQDLGNTNYQIVKDRIADAKAALGLTEQAEV